MGVTRNQVVEELSASGLLSPDDVTLVEASAAGQSDDSDGGARLLAELVDKAKLTAFQAEALMSGRGKSLVFGEYVVLDRIGQGGMGIVYKGIHRVMERTVAIKRLPQAAMQSEAMVKRFYREVRAAAKLLHPNIVAAYDAGEAHGSHYLVMEYVDGDDLSAVIRERGKLPLPQAVDVILQAARGLAFAHKKGIIHRDIKPGNILLAKDGTAKLLDMGLARTQQLAESGVMESEATLTLEGRLLGTVEYMAPEQAANAKSADHRSDIYAVGCTLYRCLIGKLPYGGSTAVEKIMAHTTQPIPSLRAEVPEAPAELDDLFKRMLAKSPADRPQSMQQVVEELEALIRDRVVPVWEGHTVALGSVEAEATISTSSIDPDAPTADMDAPTLVSGGGKPESRKVGKPEMKKGGAARATPPAAAAASDPEAPTLDSAAPQSPAAPGPTRVRDADGQTIDFADIPVARPSRRREMEPEPASPPPPPVKPKQPAAAEIPFDPAAELAAASRAARTARRKERDAGASAAPPAPKVARNSRRIVLISSAVGGVLLISIVSLIIAHFVGGSDSTAPVKSQVAAPSPGEKGASTQTTVDPTARRDTISSAAGWIDLLALIDPVKDSDLGNWARTADGIVAQGQPGVHRLLAPAVISGDYDLRVTLGPLGTRYVPITIPVGKSAVTLVYGSQTGRSFIGLEMIDGFKYRDDGNPTRVDYQSRGIDPQQPHELLIQVRENNGQASIDVDIDAKPMIAWKGALSAVTFSPYWAPRAAGRVQLCAYNGTGAPLSPTVQALSIKPLTAPLQVVRAADAAKPAAPVRVLDAIRPEHQAVQLFPLVDVKEDVPEGAWEHDGDALIAQGNTTGDSYVATRSILFPLTIDGNYEFAISVEHEGKHNIDLDLPIGDRRGRLNISYNNSLVFEPTIKSKNPTKGIVDGGGYMERRRYDHLITVKLGENNAVTVDVDRDGKRVLEWKGQLSDLEVPKPEERQHLSLRSFSIQGPLKHRFPSATLRMLTGEAKLLRPGDAGKLNRSSPAAGSRHFALHFDQPQKTYVEFPTLETDPTINGTHSFTMETWVKLDAQHLLGGNAYIMGFNNGISLTATGGGRQMTMRLRGVLIDEPKLSAEDAKKWTHYACVLDREKWEYRFYVNGKLAGKAPAEKNRIRSDGAFVLAKQLVGCMGETRLSSVARYDEEFTPKLGYVPDEHTLALYKFDEGSGEVLHDSSGHNNHGSILGGATWVTRDGAAIGQAPSPAAGSRHFALHFDQPQKTYVEFPTLETDPKIIGMHSHTMETWVKLDSQRLLGANSFVIGFNNGIKMSAIGGGHRMSMRSYGVQIDEPQLSAEDTDTWTHYACVLDCEKWEFRFYVNGKLAGKAPAEKKKIRFDGAFVLAKNLVGCMGETRLSSVARYDKDFTPKLGYVPDEHTLALYKFDEGSGEVLHDSSGHNNHGNILGGATWVTIDGGPVGQAPPPANAPFTEDQAKKHQQAWADYLSVPVEKTIDLPVAAGQQPAKMTFVLIPPGEFMMGSSEADLARIKASLSKDNSNDDVAWLMAEIDHESPQHRVRITRPFYMGKYEVTQGQWQAVMGDNPSQRADGPQYPLDSVTWYHAHRFADRLNAAAGSEQFTLPTEAQWEYACRAGTTTDWSFGDDPSDVSRYARFRGNAPRGDDAVKTQPVGSSRPNAFGLYDVHGSVMEWCLDNYAPDYYANSPIDDPAGPPTGDLRVMRGGSWYNTVYLVRSAYRVGVDPNKRSSSNGFRVVMTIDADRVGKGAAPASGQAPPPANAPFLGDEAKKHQQAWADFLNLPVVFTNADAIRFVLIPPGEFLMGSTPAQIDAAVATSTDESWRNHYRSEGPQHLVRITKPFYLAMTEITQAQWRAIVGSEPWRGKRMAPQGDQQPASWIDWAPAGDFCKKLGERDGLTYRLPTEAQWEHACRAGTTTRYSFGDNPADLPRFGWVRSNSSDQPHPVGQKLANPWGLLDMHGNVAEWCRGSRVAYTADLAIDPDPPVTDNSRSARGGAYWHLWFPGYSCGYRGPAPTIGNSEHGLRPLLEITPALHDAVKRAAAAPKP